MPPDNANISSSRTVNTSTSMNMALSSVPQATPSLSTTACRPTPKISPPPRVSASLSQVVLSPHPHRTSCGHHTVVKTALSSLAPVHRVLCSLTKLLAKESGQRSLRPKNMATHGLYGCCRRMEVDTLLWILLECYLVPIIGSPQVWWIWKRYCKLKDNLLRQTSHTGRIVQFMFIIVWSLWLMWPIFGCVCPRYLSRRDVGFGERLERCTYESTCHSVACE